MWLELGIILLIISLILSCIYCFKDSILAFFGSIGDVIGTCSTDESGKSMSGDICSKNCQCKSTNCGRLSAEDGAVTKCCPDGRGLITYGGYSYCSGMPAGTVCWSDSMCGGTGGDNFCRGNGGGTKKGICGKLGVGQKCDINSDCRNDACARETADDNKDKTCCKSGKWATFGGFDYCLEMPDGATCWSDNQCKSAYCRGNNGGLNKGKCGKLDVGQKCDKNGDCKNNACARETADDGKEKTCCKSGKWATFGGFDYCLEMPDGATCWSDNQCLSSYCRGNNGGLNKGKCGKLDVGQECDINSSCKNGACGRATAADGATKQCCVSGRVTSYGGFDYCLDMPDGSTCWSDSMCQTGYCRGNQGGLTKGTCGKLNVGQGCSSNSECNNNACGRATAADGTPTTCCASGRIGTYGGYDYCLDMPPGSTCWSDAQCRNGNCKGNLSGLQKGNCN